MLVLQSSPDVLRTAVAQAVRDGAWTTADVVASVVTDYATDRAAVVATLWDLVDEGYVRYDPELPFAGFRPCC